MRTIRVCICIVLTALAACRAGLESKERVVLARTHSGFLQLYVSGSRSKGEPAVIFEAGLGDPSETWRAVATEMATSTQIIRYDRAGLGRSPAAAALPSAMEIASQLHDALVSVHIEPPYVLVSHSAGAWYALVFAGQHPDEVKGLVLVDPTPPNFFNEIASLQNDLERREFTSSMARYETNASPARRAEWQSRDEAARQAEEAALPKGMPVVIITAAAPQPGRSPAITRYWRDQHERMTRTTSNGRLVVANSGHYVQLEQRRIVVREIRQLLTALRGRTTQGSR